MDLLEAIIIGIIQGLTEFLPVSSSGHIELAKALFKDNNMPSEGMLFTIVLHAATAFSTVVIFRKDILEIIKGVFKFKFNEHWKFVIAIGISMIPAGIVGLLFEKELEAFFYKNILLVGIMLLITGLLLFLADRAKQSEKEISWGTAALIGIAQAIAIMPGISRSGATIGTSVLLGIDRSKAARFSFLMVIPLIFGAMLLKGKKYVEVINLEELNLEGRVELVINEASKEGIFETALLTSLEPSIKMREEMWDALGTNENITSEEIQSSITEIKTGLTNAGCNETQVEFLINDSYAGFRPILKTPFSSLLAGFVAAFLTGLFACKLMINLVKKSKLKYFAFYCFAVGLISIYASF
jgi:undecaprenyl-diphosphatase